MVLDLRRNVFGINNVFEDVGNGRNALFAARERASRVGDNGLLDEPSVSKLLAG